AYVAAAVSAFPLSARTWSLGTAVSPVGGPLSAELALLGGTDTRFSSNPGGGSEITRTARRTTAASGGTGEEGGFDAERPGSEAGGVTETRLARIATSAT